MVGVKFQNKKEHDMKLMKKNKHRIDYSNNFSAQSNSDF